MRLHWKLMTTYVAIVVAVLSCVHLYLSDALQDFLVDHTGGQLARETLLAHELWRAAGGPFAAPDVDELADRVGDRLGLRVTVIDGDGNVLGDSEVAALDLSRLDNHADRTEVIEARASGLGQSRRYSATLEQHMLYVARAVPDVGDGRAVIRLAMPLTELEEILGHIGGALWVASLLGLGVSFVLVYGASRFASRPIEKLTSTALAMARSDGPVEVTVPAVAALELRELGRAMAQMHGQIQRRVGQIRTENARLAAILNSASEGILVTGLDGRTVLANDPLLAMFSVASWAQGCSLVEIVGNSRVQDAVRTTIDSGGPSAFEITVSGPPERHLDVQVAPVLQDGSCQGTVTVFYDITRLRQLERVRSDFVANVSHELRTPLTAIKGCAETLADSALDDRAAASRFVDVIGNHADRLSNLLNDLLDLSRLESDKLVLDAEPIPLPELVGTATDAVGEIAADKGITIATAVDGSLESVGDRQLIEQALINLLDNAVKYTPADGEVRVTARPAQDSLILVEVADTGIGIPADSIDRVFERFYRVDAGRSREMGGTGLGLAIVRHIIEAHGQRVFVDSTLGRGSTFGFTLPPAP